jgi:hypothetical protein
MSVVENLTALREALCKTNEVLKELQEAGLDVRIEKGWKDYGVIIRLKVLEPAKTIPEKLLLNL